MRDLLEFMEFAAGFVLFAGMFLMCIYGPMLLVSILWRMWS